MKVVNKTEIYMNIKPHNVEVSRRNNNLFMKLLNMTITNMTHNVDISRITSNLFMKGSNMNVQMAI